MSKTNEVLDQVIIKFAGDSGDGMQLTGTQFTNTAALFGNDLSTFPDFRQKFVPHKEQLQVFRAISYILVV